MNVYNRLFDDQRQTRIRLETEAINMIFGLFDKNVYTLAWSFILEDENNNNPFLERKSYIKMMAKLCDVIIEPSDNILATAKHIMSVSNAKPKDALHISCAVEYGAKFFISCDDKLIKTLKLNNSKWNKSGIKTLNPIDFIRNEVI